MSSSALWPPEVPLDGITNWDYTAQHCCLCIELSPLPALAHMVMPESPPCFLFLGSREVESGGLAR